MKFYINEVSVSHFFIPIFWGCLWHSLLWNLRLVNEDKFLVDFDTKNVMRFGSAGVPLEYLDNYEVQKVGQLGSCIWLHFIRKEQ